MFRRHAAESAVIELPIEREETVAIMVGLMSIDAKLDRITRLLTEDDDGEEAEGF